MANRESYCKTVYATIKDNHRLYALNSKTGRLHEEKT
jgi:hypothetical protein